MMKPYKLDYISPIGIVEITGSPNGIHSIMFSEKDEIVNDQKSDTPYVLKVCLNQLDEYFQGKRQTFSFPYLQKGTDFQEKVWSVLSKISFGETTTYKEIAALIGNEKAVRAVGNANGKNKLSIVIPCHRIIGANGKLTGYAGELWRKEWLLKHEQKSNKTSVAVSK